MANLTTGTVIDTFMQATTVAGARKVLFPTVTKTSAYTVTTADWEILGNHATVALTITLLAASTNSGLTFRFKNINDALMTIDGTSLGQITTVEASDTIILNRNQILEIQSDGTTWNASIFP